MRRTVSGQNKLGESASEQFLNCTSAQYRLCSAVQINNNLGLGYGLTLRCSKCWQFGDSWQCIGLSD